MEEPKIPAKREEGSYAKITVILENDQKTIEEGRKKILDLMREEVYEYPDEVAEWIANNWEEKSPAEMKIISKFDFETFPTVYMNGAIGKADNTHLNVYSVNGRAIRVCHQNYENKRAGNITAPKDEKTDGYDLVLTYIIELKNKQEGKYHIWRRLLDFINEGAVSNPDYFVEEYILPFINYEVLCHK